jgi:hypothetical protein
MFFFKSAMSRELSAFLAPRPELVVTLATAVIKPSPIAKATMVSMTEIQRHERLET